MKVTIFCPAKTAMQSGVKNTKNWLIVPNNDNSIHSIDPIMGWTSVNNTTSQLLFKFSNKEDAIQFAEEKGFEYEVKEPKQAKMQKKSYTENFTK